MKSKKVLFISQEMVPYVPASEMAGTGRIFPQAILEQGCEIRTFMPRWGIINERRNQLHEVIRLSGMNIIIDDTDHPLIIKVASIQAARMQVYFIDNDDYFHKRSMFCDENGEEYEDNAERAVFYARGVLETVKKLRWCPDIVFCQGWMSSIAPLYIRTAYQDEPAFADTKIITSVYEQTPTLKQNNHFKGCLNFRNADEKALKGVGIDLDNLSCLEQIGIAFSDGVIEGMEGVRPELLEYANQLGKPILRAPEKEKIVDSYTAFLETFVTEPAS